jgi:uncharacterized protein YhaN
VKIRGWSIDGFGVFQDYEVQGLPEGLSLFFGPNEAGKSTLLWFLRGVLFGFPDGRRNEPQFPPLRGGRHGGRVFLSGPDGDYVVDREAGRRRPCVVTGPDGETVSSAALDRLLGGADERLFRNVFAFSLTELASFESLAANGVRERILSAGIAGAGRCAHEVIDTLNARAAQLLKLRGQARVNSLVSELQALRRHAEEVRRAAGEYAARVEEEAEGVARVERLGRETDALREEKACCELLSDLWPVWHELGEAHAALDGLDPLDEFPADPDARLAVIRQASEGALQVVEDLGADQQAGEVWSRALAPDGSRHSVAHEVGTLLAELPLHRERLTQLPAAQCELTQANQVVEVALGELGAEWDAGRVESFDRSIPARREEVQEWEVRLQQVARDAARDEAALAAARVRCAAARVRRDRIAGRRLGDEPPSQETLELQEDAIRRIRASIFEQRAAEAEIEALESIARDRERAIMALAAEPHLPPSGWLTAALSAAAAAALAGAGWWAAQQHASAGAVLWTLLALLLGGIAYAVGRTRARVVAGSRQRHECRCQLDAERTEARSACDGHWKRVSACAARIAADAATLGLGQAPSIETVEERSCLLAQQRAARASLDEIDAQLTEAGAEIEAAEQEERASGSALEGGERAAAASRAEWESWKAQVGVPRPLDPAGVLGFLDAIARARQAFNWRARVEGHASKLAQAVQEWETRARAALEAARGPTEGVLEGEDLVTALCALGERFARQQELRTRIRERERELVGRIGDGPEAQAIRAKLARGRVERWQEQVQAIEERIGALQRARDEALRRHRDAETARRVLEESGAVATLDGEREALRAELAAAVREWRVLRLARTLIEETLGAFERTRQPAVLAQASQAFALVTGGRYERIVQANGGNEVAVLDREGRYRRTNTLSRGTAEQLYVCIRLGLASEYGRRSVPLPLVMDDILVNFDSGRARALAHVLARFAEEHQVLLFTCHPGTRELIADVVPTLRIVELPHRAPIDTRDDAEPGCQGRMQPGSR